MKIRLDGTPEELTPLIEKWNSEGIAVLGNDDFLKVVSVSEFYPNRPARVIGRRIVRPTSARTGRVYIETN